MLSMPVAEVLDISRDMDQDHGGNRGHAVRFEPGAELADSPHAVSAGYLWFWQSALRGASFLVRAVPRASVVASIRATRPARGEFFWPRTCNPQRALGVVRYCP